MQIFSGGIGAIIIVALTSMPSEKGNTTTGEIAMYVLYLFPQFAFSYGIFVFTKHSMDLQTYRTTTDVQEKFTQCALQNNPCCFEPNSTKCLDYLSFFGSNHNDSIRYQVIFMILHFFLYWAILLFLETGIPHKYFYKLKDNILKVKYLNEMLNDDVQKEKQRIENQLRSPNSMSDVLIAHGLKKWFGRKVYATRDLNFGVKSGECFGLLGVNGAGKTTTFKMLTGDIHPSEGESFVQGLSIVTNRAQYLKHIGYCPQFDAVNFTLTGKELLTAFAYIRGVPSHKIESEVEKWLSRYEIFKFLIY